MPNMVSRFIGKSFFACTGWTYETPSHLLSDKQVIIGFPHTSNMDAVRAFALFMALGLQTFTLIKRELFFWPLSWVLRLVGGLPVDRANSGQIVTKMADEFRQRERFTLVLAPEGTRGKSGQKPSIRTGFWHIAKAANVPIVLMLSVEASRRGRFLGRIQPTTIKDDLLQIQALYREAGVEIVLPRD